jgi:hypothetical protein
MQEFQEYPKWVDTPEGGVVVFSKEEEDGVQKSADSTETTEKVKRKRKVAE